MSLILTFICDLDIDADSTCGRRFHVNVDPAGEPAVMQLHAAGWTGAPDGGTHRCSHHSGVPSLVPRIDWARRTSNVTPFVRPTPWGPSWSSCSSPHSSSATAPPPRSVTMTDTTPTDPRIALVTDDHVITAVMITVVAHSGQRDKGNRPYISHPQRVAAILRNNGLPNAAIAAGYLHDVIEDTNVSADELLADGIPPVVVETVQLLTRHRGQPTEDYYAVIKSHPLALPVKLADIADNLDETRLEKLDGLTAARLRTKYAHALEQLASPTTRKA
jgi:hypothetical protein